MSKINSVLILDDEQNILNSLNRLFFNADFGIVSTIDPQTALKILTEEPIKVVLSDQRMPLVTGVSFLKDIKDQWPDIIRILFTGYADVEAIEDAVNTAEVYRFINKPWNENDLKITVEQAIRHFDLVKENRQLLESLEKKNVHLTALYERQKEFSSTVSHELRTPLAAIKTSIDIVLKGTPGPLNKDQARFLSKTKNNVDRLNRLINDVLDLTKLEAGKMPFRLSTHNLNELVVEVIENHQPWAQEKGLLLKSDLDKQVTSVMFDTDKIHQVLCNLISNAIKFTRKGEVVVSTRHEQKQCIVCVSDSGVGIKETDIPRLFEKFQQLGNPEERESGGTGLGLNICREIVKKHKGQLWVTSEYGQGSRFHFSLPLVP